MNSIKNSRNLLFTASCLSLTSAALIFIAREHLGHILILEEQILTKAEFGSISGWAFKGTAVALLIASPIIDWIGLKNGMLIACLCQILGIVGFVAIPEAEIMLYSMTLAGFGWGMLEVTINPLCAVQFPEEKTKRLNILHAWWPGGLILGGLLSTFILDPLGVAWEVYMLIMLVPVLIYGVMVLITPHFPKTERSEAGISNKVMIQSALKPGFLVLLFCMSLTASAELAPNQWLETTFREYANASGTLILVYGSALMFVLRFFAGTLEKILNPIGILCTSCVIASIGLYLLSVAAETQSIPLIYAAATLFYLGVCYVWPTMYSVASEQFPQGGGLTIGLIGFIGMLGVSIWIPQIGELSLTYGLTGAFKIVAILPAIAFLIFGAWWLKLKKEGGYVAVKLEGNSKAQTIGVTPGSN
ncbi:MFS transporter [Flexithrix dorotheae]|uniref:MFS transporter n=1 Tax=Flexithrix dorotheae TaxID=70993 RepID=UPI00035DB5A2|nr:MFS transporter [Flexithrix dorotheae]